VGFQESACHSLLQVDQLDRNSVAVSAALISEVMTEATSPRHLS